MNAYRAVSSASVWLAASLALVCVASPGQADIIAYHVPAGTNGTQAFSGPLGLDFDVQHTVVVTQLGVFDDGSNGLSRTITARLYARDDNTGVLLKTLSFSGTDGQLIGGSRFLKLAEPIVLPADFEGTIVAENYGTGELNGNDPDTPVWTTNDGGGLLSFVGRGRWSTTQGVFPTGLDGGPENRYAAGTFRFAAAKLPGFPFGRVVDVPNPSFELPDLTDGQSSAAPTSWVPSGGNNAGVQNPPSAGFPFHEIVPHGHQLGYVDSGTLDSAPLGETLQADTLYLLETQWGHATSSANPQHQMSLTAGGVNLGWVNNSTIGNGPTPASGQFELATGYFTANHNATLGSALAVELGHEGGGRAYYDDVRLKKITGAAVPVVNPSFEDDTLVLNQYLTTVTGWTTSSAGALYFPTSILAADGDQVAVGVGSGSLTQTLTGTTLEESTRYVLMVDVGDRSTTSYGGYRVELLAGGTAFAVDDNSLGVIQSLSPGEFMTTSVIEFTASADDPDLASLFGQPLGIRLSSLNLLSGSQVVFDNVRLFAFEVPEPTSLWLFTAGAMALFAGARRRRLG